MPSPNSVNSRPVSPDPFSDQYQLNSETRPSTPSSASSASSDVPERGRPPGDRRGSYNLRRDFSQSRSSSVSSDDSDTSSLTTASDHALLEQEDEEEQARFRGAASPHVTPELGMQADQHLHDIEGAGGDKAAKSSVFRRVGDFFGNLPNPLKNLVGRYMNYRQEQMEKQLGLPAGRAYSIEDHFSRLGSLEHERDKLLLPGDDNDSATAKLRRKQVDIQMSMLIDDILTMLKQISQISKTANEAAVRAI